MPDKLSFAFYHPRSHTGERPYKCIQCSRGFASSGVLKAHIRTHSGLKAYKCLMCDTTFTTSGSLRRHMTTHSDLRPYMCPYCQKTFKSSPNCRKHMKTHRFGPCQCVCSWLCSFVLLCTFCHVLRSIRLCSDKAVVQKPESLSKNIVTH